MSSNLLILPGNGSTNKEWAEKARDFFAAHFKSVTSINYLCILAIEERTRHGNQTLEKMLILTHEHLQLVLTTHQTYMVATVMAFRTSMVSAVCDHRIHFRDSIL